MEWKICRYNPVFLPSSWPLSFFSRDVAFLSRNGTVKCSQLYGCVDYRYLIKGKVHLIRGKLVHFPREKRRNGGKINIFGRKVHQKSGKTVHFPREKRRNGGKINIFGRKVHQKSGKMVHFPPKFR